MTPGFETPAAGDSAELSVERFGENAKPERAGFLDRHVSVPSGWFAVIALLALQYCIFVHYAQREIVWGYPTFSDQIYYLQQSYDTFEQMSSRGLLHGIVYGLQIPMPQGSLIHIQAALLYVVLGPSRLSALTVNFLDFALLQALLVYTVQWFSKRWSLAFFALGLLLSTTTAFFWAGGLYDFRIDFTVVCLYGVLLCLVIRSCIFESRPWSAAAAVAAAVLIVDRFLTAPTVCIVGALLALYLAYTLIRRDVDRDTKAKNRRRLRSMILNAGLAGILVAPVVLAHAKFLWAYYVVAQSSENAFRNAENNVRDVSDRILFYPNSLLADHLGLIFIVAAVLSLIVIAAFSRLPKAKAAVNHTAASEGDDAAAGAFVLIAFLAPLLVLTIWPSRSPVVGDVLVTPTIGIVVMAAAMLARGARPMRIGPAAFEPLSLIALITLVSGAYVQASWATHPSYLFVHGADAKQIVKLCDDVGNLALQQGWLKPRIAVDRIREYLFPTMVNPVFYESGGGYIQAEPVLGTSVNAVSEADAVKSVETTDFAILSEPDSTPESMPFNQSMKAVEKRLLQFAEDNLMLMERIDLSTEHLRLYMRPALRLDGTGGSNWLTTDGATVVGPAAWLRQRPTIELSGPSETHVHYNDGWKVKAQLLLAGQSPVDVPATITPPADQYTIQLRLDPKSLPNTGDVRVHFAVDKYWIPRDQHVNEDIRRLAVPTPTKLVALKP